MENKKSFILYCDLIHTIQKLPDDKAGQLLKIILDYVNDKNPVVEDLLLQIAFEPIKHQLKRDLVRWNEFRHKQSENGKLGGRPKKAKPKSQKPKNPSLISESQKSLNATVTVNATVTEEGESGLFAKHAEFSKLLLQKDSLDKNQIEVQVRKFITEDTLKIFNAHLHTEKKKHQEQQEYNSHFRSWFAKQKVDVTANRPRNPDLTFEK